jgi:hypothetical protein
MSNSSKSKTSPNLPPRPSSLGAKEGSVEPIPIFGSFHLDSSAAIAAKSAIADSTPAEAGTNALSEYQILEQIEHLLSGVSNKKSIEIISMVMVKRNMRLISMDRPITTGQIHHMSSGQSNKTAEIPNAIAKGQKTQSYFSKDPEYLSVQKERAEVVETLKASIEAEKPALVERLSTLNQSLKNRKSVLKSNLGPAAGSLGILR